MAVGFLDGNFAFSFSTSDLEDDSNKGRIRLRILDFMEEGLEWRTVRWPVEGVRTNEAPTVL
ncbi:hypothetical protein LguiA_026268 [Lonicera macranthoides]